MTKIEAYLHFLHTSESGILDEKGFNNLMPSFFIRNSFFYFGLGTVPLSFVAYLAGEKGTLLLLLISMITFFVAAITLLFLFGTKETFTSNWERMEWEGNTGLTFVESHYGVGISVVTMFMIVSEGSDIINYIDPRVRCFLTFSRVTKSC